MACYGCSSSDAMFKYDNGYYCFSCQKSFNFNKLKIETIKISHIEQDRVQLPEDIEYTPENFSVEALEWLYQYDILSSLIYEYKIGYSPSLQRVVLPNYVDKSMLLSYQTRSLSKYDSPKYLSYGPKSIMRSRGPLTDTVVIVEDYISCIKVGQSCKAVALLGTKTENLDQIISWYPRIIIWLDSDGAGQRSAQKLLQTCSLYRETRNIITELDPKGYTKSQIEEILWNI